MNKEQVTKDILSQIEENEMTPRPRWQFVVRAALVWALAGFSLIMGGLATALMIFILVNGDWEVSSYVSGNALQHFIEVAPTVWFLLFLGGISLAYYNLLHTKRGYRYSLIFVLFVSVAMSGIFGGTLYATGLSHRIDHTLGRHLPLYTEVMQKRAYLWSKPDDGLLVGAVVSYDEDRAFTLEDVHGTRWQVVGGELSPREMVIIRHADAVSLIGHREGERSFVACAVKPWHIRGMQKGMAQKMHEEGEVMMRGVVPQKLAYIKKELRKHNIDERNTTRMRTTLCERK